MPEPVPAGLRPVYTPEEMREVDRWAIEERGVPSLDLMEAAGGALAEVVIDVAQSGRVAIVCGKGNNGGDGLVAARRLREAGYEVDPLLLGPLAELGGDAAVNAGRLDGIREVAPGDLPGLLADAAAVVDALLGTGFGGAVREPLAGAIRALNDCDAPVVACDVASGVDAATGEVGGEAVRAEHTVTFHGPKVGHLLHPGKAHTGRLTTVPIGIPPGSPAPARAGVIDDVVLGSAPRRGPASTKFSSGNVVVVGGSRGLTGAVCMAAQAAGRAGAGYVTAAVPASLESIFEVKLTETMTVGCADRDGSLGTDAVERVLQACGRAGAVIIGSGLGREPAAEGLVAALLEEIEAPVILDADGLNAMAGRLPPLRARPGPTVLTPHEGELGRLLDLDAGEVRQRRLHWASEAARQSGALVVLKGDDTIITDGETTAVNALAAPALATAGTGDVLAGVVAALVARGMPPFEGACAGVLACARAGCAAAEAVGLPEAVIATDVIAAVPHGLRPAIL